MGEAAALCPPNCHPQIYLTAIAQKYNLKGIFYVDLWPVADPQVIVTDVDLMDQIHVKRAFPQYVNLLARSLFRFPGLCQNEKLLGRMGGGVGSSKRPKLSRLYLWKIFILQTLYKPFDSS